MTNAAGVSGRLFFCITKPPQKQNGLYSVACHPLGGSPEPSLFADLYEVIESIPGAELRLSPEEMFYVINCRAEDVKKVLEVTSSEKAVCSCSRFEESVACIGASICQQGVRDSQALLHRLIEMEREEGEKITLASRKLIYSIRIV